MQIEINNVGSNRYIEAGAVDKIIDMSDTLLEKITTGVKAVATQISEQFTDGKNMPSTVEIKFGVNIDMDANILVSKSSFGSNFEITLTWEKVNHEG